MITTGMQQISEGLTGKQAADRIYENDMANQLRVAAVESAVSGLSSGIGTAILGIPPSAEIDVYNVITEGTYPLYGGLIVTPEELASGLVQFVRTGAGDWVKRSISPSASIPPIRLQDLADPNPTGRYLRNGDIVSNITGLAGEGITAQKVTEETADGVLNIEIGNEVFRRVFSGAASVNWFGAKGDGVTDDTAAVQAALDSGQDIRFEVGVYLVGALNVPVGMRGKSIQGAGYYHYDGLLSTVLKAIGEIDLLTLGDGCDCVTIRGIRFDGGGVATIGINGTFGSFLSIDNCGFYNFTEFGTFSRQGLGRYTKSFWGGNKVGAEVFSDSSISDCEFTTGETPLRLSAGGNRLVNVWANSGTECCVELKVLNSSTSHINTSIVNLYAGEVYAQDEETKPILKISGLSNQRIQQVQLSNSHIVNAAGGLGAVNGGILMDYVESIAISNIEFLGFGEFATSSDYTEYFIKASNTIGLKVNNCGINKVNKNAIYLGAGCEDVNIVGNIFKSCGAYIAVGNEGANIYNVGAARVIVSGNQFVVVNGSAVPFAMYSDIDSFNIIFSDNFISYANGKVFDGANFSGSYKRAGSDQTQRRLSIETSTITPSSVNNAGKNYLSRAQAAGSGGDTISFMELPADETNKTFLVTVIQAGNGANGTTGVVFAFGESFGAATTGNSNTNPVLENELLIEDGILKMTIGTGYGLTTFEAILTPLG